MEGEIEPDGDAGIALWPRHRPSRQRPRVDTGTRAVQQSVLFESSSARESAEQKLRPANWHRVGSLEEWENGIPRGRRYLFRERGLEQRAVRSPWAVEQRTV